MTIPEPEARKAELTAPPSPSRENTIRQPGFAWRGLKVQCRVRVGPRCQGDFAASNEGRVARKRAWVSRQHISDMRTAHCRVLPCALHSRLCGCSLCRRLRDPEFLCPVGPAFWATRPCGSLRGKGHERNDMAACNAKRAIPHARRSGRRSNANFLSGLAGPKGPVSSEPTGVTQ